MKTPAEKEKYEIEIGENIQFIHSRCLFVQE